MRRPGSPLFGFSILTTSAPSQASASVQVGPASNCVRSTTRTPCRQLSGAKFPLIQHLLHTARLAVTAIGEDSAEQAATKPAEFCGQPCIAPGRGEAESRFAAANSLPPWTLPQPSATILA